jgi:hypothetical protein
MRTRVMRSAQVVIADCIQVQTSTEQACAFVDMHALAFRVVPADFITLNHRFVVRHGPCCDWDFKSQRDDVFAELMDGRRLGSRG